MKCNVKNRVEKRDNRTIVHGMLAYFIVSYWDNISTFTKSRKWQGYFINAIINEFNRLTTKEFEDPDNISIAVSYIPWVAEQLGIQDEVSDILKIFDFEEANYDLILAVGLMCMLAYYNVVDKYFRNEQRQKDIARAIFTTYQKHTKEQYQRYKRDVMKMARIALDFFERRQNECSIQQKLIPFSEQWKSSLIQGNNPTTDIRRELRNLGAR